MDDDKDPALSSDDLLRAARAEAGSPSRDLETSDTRRVVQSGQRPADAAGTDLAGEGPVPSAERSVAGTARLATTGDFVDRLKREEYLLTVDGRLVARVNTGQELGEAASGFANVASFRVTSVSFLDRDGLKWHIGAEEPGPRRVKTKRSGKEKELLFSAHERRVYVREEPMPRLLRADSNVETKRLAETVGPLENRWGTTSVKAATVVASGTSFPLRGFKVGAKRGAIGDLAVISRDYPLWYAPWSVNATSAVPLSVILLYWHLLMGDFSTPSSGA
jgi:hypothetical protein